MNFLIFHNIIFDLFVALLALIFLGLTYIATVRSERERYAGTHDSPVLVIVPCRGNDYSLADNLASIKSQDYANYRVLAVVDSEDDEALEAIRKSGMDWILSSDGCRECSGKVRAISTAISANPDFSIYVIADSDILVRPDWLRTLVSPLGSKKYGISTSFPYFNPVGGFWSRVKLVWGFVGMGMMESRLTRFGWGGSLAFRKELLDGKRMDFFRSYVSDDVALTKLCKEEGMKISYVKEAMPLINSPDDFSTFMEWANRQTALSIYSTRNVLYYGLTFYGATILLFISAIFLTAFVDLFFAVFLIPAFINGARASARAGRMRVSAFLISLLVPFIYFYNLVKASRMETISWRGRDYSLNQQ